MSGFPVDALEIGSVTISGKGAKRAPFTVNGSPVVAKLDPMAVAFEPSAFKDREATRVNFVFHPSDAVVAELDKLDEWILQEVIKDPIRYFAKARSEAQIRESYSPIVKRHEKYMP